MSLKGFTCWKADDAEALLQTEAVREHDEALFMATHTPVEDFNVSGKLSALMTQKTERGLLEILSSEKRKHTFVALVGEAGSGKSHLIRWLKLNWPKTSQNNDLVLLIQRSDSSLNRTLQQFRDVMPQQHRYIFEGLGQVQQTTDEGRSRDFVAKLANSLGGDYFDKDAFQDNEWCNKWHLDRIIRHHITIEEWQAPRRILRILSGNEGQRNSQLAEFSLRDLIELSDLGGRIREVGQKALLFKKRLAEESALLIRMLDEGHEEAYIAKTYYEQCENILKLQEALNYRLNHAVQNLLGISARDLQDRFSLLRQELRKENQRLVLLLEDLTSTQGIDNQLVEALIKSSESDSSYCDMISVVGVTPYYMGQKWSTVANITTRLDLRIDMGQSDTGIGFQDVASLRTDADVLNFGANYLRSVRAGVANLEDWYMQTQGEGQVPNRCSTCPFRPECHTLFGSVDLPNSSEPIGLYPFNEKAMVRLFHALEAENQTVKTPRGMIKGILYPSLIRPDAVAEGNYPIQEIENDWIRSRPLLGLLASIVEGHVSEEKQEQMRRLLVWWGEEDDASTRSEDDMLTFATLPQGAFETYQLPWLGDASQAQASLIQLPAAPESDAEFDSSDDENQITSQVLPKRKVSAVPVGSPKEKSVTKTAIKSLGTVKDEELVRRQAQLKEWEQGGAMKEVESFWQERLMEVLRDLPWRKLGVDQYLQTRLFTRDSIIFEGSGRNVDARHFLLPREKWLSQGLEAHLQLRSKNPPQQSGELDILWQRVGVLLRKLGQLVQEKAASLLPSINDTPWSPSASAAQVLWIRSWLRGVMPIDSTPAQQWEILLKEQEDESLSYPESRVESWTKAINISKNYHEEIRQNLKFMINLPQDEQSNAFSVADLSEVAPALKQLQNSLKMASLPKDKVEFITKLSCLSKILDAAQKLQGTIEHIPSRELEHVEQWTQTIQGAIKSEPLSHYISRLNTLRETLGKTYPYPADTFQIFSKRVDQLRGERATLLIDALEGYLVKFNQAEAFQEVQALNGLDVLKWALGLPVRELDQMKQICQESERAIDAIHEHVSRFVDSQTVMRPTSGGTLAQVHEIGKETGLCISRIKGEL
ncbi:MAG: hypothetical protein ACO1RX_08280 [Candidatus Sericytochromatia bacterium]